MGVHASAIKKDRQALRRREHNRAMLATLKTAIKKTRVAFEAKDVATARQALAEVIPALDKAAAKKLIHKNRASRLVSRLTKHTSRLPSSPST